MCLNTRTNVCRFKETFEEESAYFSWQIRRGGCFVWHSSVCCSRVCAFTFYFLLWAIFVEQPSWSEFQLMKESYERILENEYGFVKSCFTKIYREEDNEAELVMIKLDFDAFFEPFFGQIFLSGCMQIAHPFLGLTDPYPSLSHL